MIGNNSIAKWLLFLEFIENNTKHKDISRKLAVDASRFSQIAKILIVDGLITKERSNNKDSLYLYSITDKGREIRECIRKINALPYTSSDIQRKNGSYTRLSKDNTRLI